jgi:hypothetical protein
MMQMKKTTLKIVLCFIVGTAIAQDISTDTIVTETPMLIEFRRHIYLDGWEIKHQTLPKQRIYMRPWRVDRHEIRSIMMADSPELLLYEQGRRNRNLGNTFLIIGIPATLSVVGAPVGGPMVAGGVFFRANSEHRLADAINMHNARIGQFPSFLNELNHFRNQRKVIKYHNIASISFYASGALLLPSIYFFTSDDNTFLGVVCAVNSIGLAINGLLFSSASRTYFRKVVEFNNNTNVELNLGFTNNGPGLIARF